MPNWFRYLISFTLCCSLFTTNSLGQTVPSGFSTSSVGSGWVLPVGVTFNKAGTKMFVWEKGGTVSVSVWNAGTQTYVKQSSLLLNITEEVGDWRDHGLLGFALDPNFDVNGLFYVAYVVDRHHLLYYGTPSYNPATNLYFDATIGRVTRYKAITNASSELVADPASRFILIGETKTTGIPILYESHGIGTLTFASDSTLLVSCGDGASFATTDIGSDPGTFYQQALADGIIRPKENVGAFRAQLVDCLNGKVLRIDPATGNGISSNPFYDPAQPRAAKSRVWAMGFRNPFRITVRPNTGSLDRTTGDIGEIYVGDVGYNLFEELNIIKAPAMNCGWPIFEGITTSSDYAGLSVPNQDEPNPAYGTGSCFQQYFTFQNLLKQATADNNTTVYNPCNPALPITGSPDNRYFHRVPALDWHHNFDSARVRIFSGNAAGVAQLGSAASGTTGIPFRGSSSIAGCWYTGNMFPASYQNTYFHADYGANWIKNLSIQFIDQVKTVNEFATGFLAIVHVAENPLDGSLFTVDIGNNTIRKISYGGNRAPVVVMTSNKKFGPGPLSVNFTGSGSSDPDGGAITYSWDFGDGTALSTTANPSHTFTPPNNQPRKYVVTLTVKDNLNATQTDSIIISVNNTPPVVSITSPVKNSFYTIGGDTTYSLQATVTDTEHSPAQLSYQWQTILRHNTHEHQEPVDTNRVTSAVINRIGCNGETYYWFIKLTVTDAAGLSTVDSSKLFPACPTGPPVINSDPVSQTVCEGAPVSFSSSVSDIALPGIQWQKSSNNGVSWTNIAGATSGSLQFTTALADHQSQYRAIWTNTLGADTSLPATLSITAAPAAPDGSSGQAFCSAATVTDLTATGTLVKWYSEAAGGSALGSTAPLTNGDHYFASQTVNGCESIVRLNVAVSVNTSGNNTITLNGGNSSGPVTSYLWTLVSGPNTPVITSPASVSTTVTGLTKGTYIFRLSVNNGASLSLVKVNVNPAAAVLAADAGYDRSILLPQAAATLSGAGSTGTIRSYSWRKISGPGSPAITAPTQVSTSVTGLVQGTYNFELSVTDINSTVRKDTVVLTVLPAASGITSPVIAAADPVTGLNNTAVNNLIAVPPGSLIVLTIAQADAIPDGANATVSSIPALSWTKRSDAGAVNSGNAEIYTAVYASGGSLIITSTWAVNKISTVAYTVSNYDAALTGAAAAGNNQSAPSVALATTRAKSIIFAVSSDYTAKDGAARVYRDAATEVLYDFANAIYAGYHYYKITTNSGTYTEGLSAPTAMSAGTALLEVIGPNAVVPAPVAHAGDNLLVYFTEAPQGSSVQQKCTGSTVSSLSATGSSIKWYAAATGGSALPVSTVLTNGTHYYASQTVNGCESLERLDVSVQLLSNPAAPVVSTQQNCNGSVTLSTASSGTYLWSTGAVTSSITVALSGTYTLTLTNGNGCSSSTSLDIVPGTALGLSVTQTNISVFGAASGAISGTASGGTAPYMYSIDNSSFQSSGDFTGLTAGVYTLIVRDANNCTSQQQVTLTQPAVALAFTIDKTVIPCPGLTCTLTLTASGGTAPYTYSNDGGLTYQSSPVFTGIGAGTYTLRVKDANNVIRDSVELVQLETATWTGASSSDWHLAANWSTGTVPGSTTHVIIPAGTTFTCTISSSDVTVASMQIRQNARVDIQNARQLLILNNCSSLPGNQALPGR